MANAKYRICKDYDGDCRWTLVAPNGKEIAKSEGYFASKSACLRSINTMRKYSKTMRIQEED